MGGRGYDRQAGFDGRLRGVWARFAGAAFAVDAAILFGEVARLPAGEPRSARRSRAKQGRVRLHDLEVNLGWQEENDVREVEPRAERAREAPGEEPPQGAASMRRRRRR